MKLIIDIPEEIYNSACATNNIWDMRMAGFVCSAIANGTPLDQEPCGDCCGDCISRQAVLDINENHHGQMPNHINHQIFAYNIVDKYKAESRKRGIKNEGIIYTRDNSGNV